MLEIIHAMATTSSLHRAKKKLKGNYFSSSIQLHQGVTVYLNYYVYDQVIVFNCDIAVLLLAGER